MALCSLEEAWLWPVFPVALCLQAVFSSMYWPCLQPG